jgi:hypothetical protein
MQGGRPFIATLHEGKTGLHGGVLAHGMIGEVAMAVQRDPDVRPRGLARRLVLGQEVDGMLHKGNHMAEGTCQVASRQVAYAHVSGWLGA